VDGSGPTRLDLTQTAKQTLRLKGGGPLICRG